ncbi:MAG: tetratricopeptide repeat protein [Elusimicrobiota bacterium]
MIINAIVLFCSLQAGAASPNAEIAAQSLLRKAEAAINEAEYADARHSLEILVQRYPLTEAAINGRRLLQNQLGIESIPASIQADEPFVPPTPSQSPDDALANLRGAIANKNANAALAQATDFKRQYPSHPASPEVDLAVAALHLRRGEAAKAQGALMPLIESPDPAVRSKSLHLLGAAMAALGLDEETLAVIPEVDSASATDRWLALAQIWRAAAEDRLGRKTAAAEHYRAVSASGLNSPARAYALAMIASDWARQGKHDRARNALERAEEEAAKWDLSDVRESASLSGAHMLMQAHNYAQAAQAYERFVERFPKSPMNAQALYQRGLCLKKLNDIDQAIAAFKDLGARHPTSAFAAHTHLQLGQLYNALGKSDLALENYRLMARVSQAPDAERESLLLMAQVHYNSNNWKQAVPLYRQYLAAAPGAKTGEVEALLLTALWQADKNDPELASLAARNPEHPLVPRIGWDLAAKAYTRGDWAGAENLFRRHIESSPRAETLADARFYHAECLRQLNRTQDAAEAYRRFLREHPKHPRAQDAAMNLGGMLFDAGDFPGSAQAYALVAGTGAAAAEARYNLALALTKSGKNQEAEKAWSSFAQAFARHEKASSAWAQSARLREERGDLDGAAAAYARATGPAERLKSLYGLGLVQERRKKIPEAKAAYESLKSQSPKSDPVRLSGLLRLALLLELEDDSKAARPLYDEIINLADKSGSTFETARKRRQAL